MPARPRVTPGAAFTLGSFALLAPQMVFPALTLLLWWSPPARPNTRWLVGVGTLYAAAMLLTPGPLAQEALDGWAVVGAALFLIFMLRTRLSPADGAITAALLGAGGVLAWFFAFRVDPAFPVRETVHAVQQLYARAEEMGVADPAQVDAASDFFAHAALATPAVTMLIGVSAFLTTWRWYHIFADRPAGTPPGDLTGFRFNDQILWVLVLGTSGVVAQSAGYLDPALLWPLNLLVFAAGLYLARGVAVVRARTGPWPLPLLLVGALAVLFLWPLLVPPLFGLGLADVWFDFRRRPAAPSGA